jgi:singapore isolate B (sub-type 7) whole genome shotgun sequence assembly, scaffold_1
LEGEEREKWWNEMKEILSITEEELKEREKWQKKPEEK